MGRMLMLIVIAGSTCALVLWLVAPRLLPSGNSPAASAPAYSGQTAPSSPQPPRAEYMASSTQHPAPSLLPNLAPVQTPEQNAVKEYEAQRTPFYDLLRRQCGDLVVEGRPAQEDRSILVLYATRHDGSIVTDLLARVVNPYAYAYGFRHVRFYLPNPRGSVEHYQLAAEASSDGNGRWQAFQH